MESFLEENLKQQQQQNTTNHNKKTTKKQKTAKLEKTGKLSSRMGVHASLCQPNEAPLFGT